MHKYKTLAAIAYGGRIEKGSIVELPEEVAAAYGPEYLEPLSGAVKADNSTDEKAVADMNQNELKAKAKELGLPTGGSKADLVERITLQLDANAGDEETTEEETEGDEPEEETAEETA